MHASTICQIVFSATNDKLEATANYLEKMQRGEYFMDEEGESLVLYIEEDLDLTGKEDILNFIEKLYKKLQKMVDIHALGTFNSLDSDAHQSFECQYNKNFFRYRETDWQSDLAISENLSYEEFEEEGYVDMDEDEYEESLHRIHEGIENEGDVYGDWEYID